MLLAGFTLLIFLHLSRYTFMIFRKIWKNLGRMFLEKIDDRYLRLDFLKINNAVIYICMTCGFLKTNIAFLIINLLLVSIFP